MIWVLEWCNSDGECNASLWDSKESAEMQACKEISEHIGKLLDLTSSDIPNGSYNQFFSYSVDFLSAVRDRKHSYALKHWNDLMADIPNTCAYWSVNEKQILSHSKSLNSTPKEVPKEVKRFPSYDWYHSFFTKESLEKDFGNFQYKGAGWYSEDGDAMLIAEQGGRLHVYYWSEDPRVALRLLLDAPTIL